LFKNLTIIIRAAIVLVILEGNGFAHVKAQEIIYPSLANRLYYGLDFYTKSHHQTNRTVGKDLSTSFKALGYTVSRPFHWNKKDWATFGIWAGITAGAFLLDEEVRDFWLRNQNDVGDTFERIGYYWGSPTFTVPFTLVTYTGGVLFGSPGIRDTGLMMVELLMITGLIQQPLRVIVGRARPHTNEGNHSFNPFSPDNAYGSFISGHAWSAVGISTILIQRVNHPAATALFGSLGLITALSRMYADKHWFSDVLMGSALGYYSAKTILRWNESQSIAHNKFMILLTTNGITLTYKF
jgi:membrane-associated phospholipid phosphatase